MLVLPEGNYVICEWLVFHCQFGLPSCMHHFCWPTVEGLLMATDVPSKPCFIYKRTDCGSDIAHGIFLYVCCMYVYCLILYMILYCNILHTYVMYMWVYVHNKICSNAPVDHMNMHKFCKYAYVEHDIHICLDFECIQYKWVYGYQL